MATNYETVTSLLKATCDAIREKEGSTELINHQDIPSRIQNLKSSKQDVLSLVSGLTKYNEAFEIDGEQRGNALVSPSDFSDESKVTWSDTDYSSYFSYSIESIEGSENGVGAAIIPTSTTTTDYKHIFWFDAASLDSTSSVSKTYLIAFRAKASAIPTNYLPQLGICYYATNTTSGSKWLYYSFVPSTDWEIFYTIATVPSNNYLKDITMCYCNRGISHYVDWLVAYDITGSNFSNMTFGARTTATNSNVLSGKTYYKDGILYTGTMTNNGTVSGSVTSLSTPYTIPAGYHSGSGTVSISDSDLVASNIKSGINILGVTGTLDSVSTNCNTWQVQNVGATYGFTKLSDGYYESTNQGINSSVSLCKIKFRILLGSVITFSCISYAESSYDYGMIGVTNVTLDETYDSSEYNDTTKIQKHFKSSNSSSVQTYTMTLTKGEYEVYIKYFKDGSNHSGNDSFRFKVTGGAVEIDPVTGVNPTNIVSGSATIYPGETMIFTSGTYMPTGYSVDAGSIITSGGYAGDTDEAERDSTNTIIFNCDSENLIGYTVFCEDMEPGSSSYDNIVCLAYTSNSNESYPYRFVAISQDGNIGTGRVQFFEHEISNGQITITLTASDIRFKSGYTYHFYPYYSG